MSDFLIYLLKSLLYNINEDNSNLFFIDIEYISERLNDFI